MTITMRNYQRNEKAGRAGEEAEKATALNGVKTQNKQEVTVKIYSY